MIARLERLSVWSQPFEDKGSVVELDVAGLESGCQPGLRVVV